MEPGDVVLVRAFDDVPEHWFRVEEVYQDRMTGVAITGPLQGEYGEPELSMVIRVLDPEEVQLGTRALQMTVSAPSSSGESVYCSIAILTTQPPSIGSEFVGSRRRSGISWGGPGF